MLYIPASCYNYNSYDDFIQYSVWFSKMMMMTSVIIYIKNVVNLGKSKILLQVHENTCPVIIKKFVKLFSVKIEN